MSYCWKAKYFEEKITRFQTIQRLQKFWCFFLYANHIKLGVWKLFQNMFFMTFIMLFCWPNFFYFCLLITFSFETWNTCKCVCHTLTSACWKVYVLIVYVMCVFSIYAIYCRVRTYYSESIVLIWSTSPSRVVSKFLINNHQNFPRCECFCS